MISKRTSDSGLYPTLLPVCGGPDKKLRVLDKDVAAVGRARGCDIILDANEVSAVHCIFYRAAVGFRIRDCGSRTGTRVNGGSVRNHVLADGDIVQIGPFSFELKLPPGLGTPPAIDPEHLERSHRSRRNLVRLALQLRRKLRAAGDTGSGMIEKAADLKTKIRSYDQKLTQLETSELELAQEREQLDTDKEDHRHHVQEVEADLAKRLAEVESAVKARWAEFQKRCGEEDARLSAVGATPGAQDDAQRAALQGELDEREAKLQEREAAHVVKQRQVSQEQEKIERARTELEKQKSRFEAEQAQARAVLEQQRGVAEQAAQAQQQLAALRVEIDEREGQLIEREAALATLQSTWEAEQAQARAALEQQHGAAEQATQAQQQLATLQSEIDDREGQLIQREAAFFIKHHQATQDWEKLNQERSEFLKLKAGWEEQHAQAVAALEQQQAEPKTQDDAELAALRGELDDLAAQLQEREAGHDATERQLSEDAARIEQERHELAQSQTRWQAEQAQIRAELEKQRSAAEQAEAALRQHKGDVARMLQEIKGIQEEVRTQPRGDQRGLQQENEQLKHRIEEYEVRLANANKAAPEDLQQLQAENDFLRRFAQEKDQLLEDLRTAAAARELTPAVVDERILQHQAEGDRLSSEVARLQQQLEEASHRATAVAAVPRGDADLENYEAELNGYRQQLESDRAKLNKEIEALRARNGELDEAIREMEMEMSRERAEMARERIRLERMREEIKVDMERLQRDGGVRESLAGFQRLRDEVKTSSSGTRR